MKKQKSIFEKIKPGIVLCTTLFAICSFTAYGTGVDNSCDEDSGNDYINQRLALCSVHAYNIGSVSNPSDPALKQTMNDVVALKTTIMTQQMKKQYDFLEATIKRLKIQMEKAILVSKLEASGAASTSESSSGNSAKTAYLNCSFKGSAETIQCVRQNLGIISSEFSGKGETAGVSAAIKKHLKTEGDNVNAFLTTNKIASCENVSNVTSAKTCMQDLNGGVYRMESQGQQRTSGSAGGAYTGGDV